MTVETLLSDVIQSLPTTLNIAKAISNKSNENFDIDPELAAILAQLEAKTGSDSKSSGVVFLKEGEHVLKMVLPFGRTLVGYFESYINTYNDQQFTYYIVNAVVVKSTQEELVDRNKIRHIKATKTMVKGITAQIGNWPNLFDDEGPVVLVKIYKEGGQTKYLVSIMNKKFDSSESEYPEISIEQAAKDLEVYSAKKANESSSQSLPFAAPKSSSDQVPW